MKLAPVPCWISERPITINFHSSWDEDTYVKAKKYSKFCRRFAAQLYVQFNSSSKANAPSFVFLKHFCSHFISRRVTNDSKSWIPLWSDNVHYHVIETCLIQETPHRASPVLTHSNREGSLQRTYLNMLSLLHEQKGERIMCTNKSELLSGECLGYLKDSNNPPKICKLLNSNK